MNRRIRKAVLPLIMLAAVFAIPALAASGPGVSGGGSGLEPPESGFPPGTRHDIQIVAKGLGTAAKGRFHFTHVEPTGETIAEFAGEVMCLVVDGDRAAVTGKITDGYAPGRDPRGETIALTIEDGVVDRVGFDLSFFPEDHTIAPCQSVEPFLEIDRGDFRVRS